MLTSATGTYRDGKIFLSEQPRDLPEDTLVIVTFLAAPVVDLAARDIDAAEAEELRASPAVCGRMGKS